MSKKTKLSISGPRPAKGVPAQGDTRIRYKLATKGLKDARK